MPRCRRSRCITTAPAVSRASVSAQHVDGANCGASSSRLCPAAKSSRGKPRVLAHGATIRDLADWLGHESPAYTLRVYSRLMAGYADKMRAAIDAEFSGLEVPIGAPEVR
jgi:hypothetical protein